MRLFAEHVTRLGYTAVTLDDLAHLAPHPLHEPDVADRIAFLRERFSPILRMLHGEFGLRVYLTSDVLPLTRALTEAMGDDETELAAFYQNLVRKALDGLDSPQSRRGRGCVQTW